MLRSSGPIQSEFDGKDGDKHQDQEDLRAEFVHNLDWLISC